MAELIQKKNTSSTCTITADPSPFKPKSTNCFGLACFGFSSSSKPKPPRTSRSSNSKSSPTSLIKIETNYIPSQHHHHDGHEYHKTNDIKGSSGNSRRWYLISWSTWRRFGTNINSATKTVPVDTSGTVTQKRARQSKVKYILKTTKSKSTPKSGKPLVSDSKREVPATNDGELPPADSLSQRQAVLPSPVSDPHSPLTQKPLETNTIRLESRRHLESSKDDTCQKRFSFRRKRGGGASNIHSQPSSPVQEETKDTSFSSRTATAVISHSASFPTQKSQSRRAENPLAHKHNKQDSSGSTSTVSNKAASKTNKSQRVIMSNYNIKNSSLDPLVGMSIMTVTLIIMIFWGRLCAILCTSAWFYFLPRLRSSAAAAAAAGTNTSTIFSSNINNPRELDLNSEEYKKKVVLEGFLERNHRNNIL